MESQNFFSKLKLLNNEFIQKKQYPNAIFSDKYLTASSLQKSSNVLLEGKMYLKFINDDTDTTDYLSIDDELYYIDTLNIQIKTPTHTKLQLEKYIIEAIAVFDSVLQNQDTVNINFIADIDDIFYYLKLINSHTENNTLKRYTIKCFPNPIARDIYIAQFLYFIKTYLTYIFANEKNNTLVPKNIFLSKVINSLKEYIASPNFMDEQRLLKRNLNLALIDLQPIKG